MRYCHLILPTALMFALSLTSRAQEAERIELEISEETTFFTEPVTDDGLIDYVAALNAHYGEGIANEDNAFVLMVQLFPPPEAGSYHEDSGYWEALFLELDIEKRVDIPRIEYWDRYAQEVGLQADQADGMFDEAFVRPWTDEEFPELAAWLEANEAALDLLAQSIARSDYYSPLVRTENEPLIAVLLPHLGEQRRLARILAIRGFQAMVAGDDRAMIGHLNMLHRMGKLISNEPTLIGKLVGISIQAIQTNLIEAVTDRGHLDHEIALWYLQAHAEIGGIDSIWEAMSYGERVMALDTIQQVHAGSEGVVELIMSDFEDEELSRTDQYLSARVEEMAQSPHFDVTRAMQEMNGRFDRFLTVRHIKDRGARKDAYAAFDESLLADAEGELVLQLIGLSATRRLPNDWTVERYTDSVTGIYARLLIAALDLALRTEERLNTRRLVESTAIALLGYRDVHGELPESLEDLVPVYFEAVPMDPYSEAPLVYRVDDDGSALVYSIGDNFEDNDGVDDYSDGDIAITIGVPPAESD